MAEASPFSEMAALSLDNCVQAAIDCDLCEGTTDVDWRCETCSAKICAKCKAIHESRKAFRHHKIIIRRRPKPFIPSNIKHIKDFSIECDSMVEIHHNGSKAMLEYKKDSKWFISTIDEDGKITNPKKFNFTTHGFTICPTGVIYVCDVDDNLIWRILPDGTMKKTANTTPDTPWGVCLNSNGNLVVCLKLSIAIFSKDKGKRLKTVKNLDEEGKTLFTWAYKIFQDQQKQYRLLDWNRDGKPYVFGFDKLFKLQWSYRSKQSESIDVISICGDGFQNVLLGYYSSTVELLDSRGNFLMYFRTSNSSCSYPQQISVSENNVLWLVNEYDRKVFLFQYT